MLSRWLRRYLALEVLLVVCAVLLARASGLSATTAALLGTVVFFILNSVAVIVTYGFALWHGFATPPARRVPRWRVCGAAVLEWLATFALFVLVQPFERWWMGADGLGRRQPAPHVVLLIHGYLCNRGMWWWLRRGLRAQGRAVATVNLEPPLGSIEVLAECLRARIESLLAETGAESAVLVGHSMGGLVARAYLRRHGTGHVAKLITLGSPHHGTRLARLGRGRNAREMEPDSGWMRAWAEADYLSVPALSVWSARDNYVIPQDSSHMAGARETVLPALGHLSMAFSPKILEILLNETSEPSVPIEEPGPPAPQNSEP